MKNLSKTVTTIVCVICVLLLAGNVLYMANDIFSISSYATETYTSQYVNYAPTLTDVEVSVVAQHTLLDKLSDNTNILSTTYNETYKKYENIMYKYENVTLETRYLFKVLEECKKNNIDPDIMLAIFFKESRFDPLATNSVSDARGLGQLMSSTGRWLYGDIYGHPELYTHDMAYDANLNIEMATYLIGYYHNKYDDPTYKEALTHYAGAFNEEYYADMHAYANALKTREKSYNK